MAITKSQTITDFEAGTLIPVRNLGGRLREIVGTKELATTEIDNANDAVLLCPLPSGARVTEIYLMNDDLDSNGTPTLAVDVGLYSSDGSTIKDADAYASAITQLQAAVKDFDDNLAYEARDIANVAKQVFEDAGDTSDPGGFYYLAIDVTTAAATAAAGTLTWVVRYVVD